MRSFIPALYHRARRFAQAEDGLVLTEFLILLPLLLWVFMAMVTFWDAYRTLNEGQKASYAAADLISRQSEVSETFLGGLDDTIAHLMRLPTSQVRVRVTSIQWKAEDQRFVRLFSYSPSNRMTPLTEAQINTPAFLAHIPNMSDRDSVVVFESLIDFHPIFISNGKPREHQSVFFTGLNLGSFENIIVTRPRNYLRICMAGGYCPARI